MVGVAEPKTSVLLRVLQFPLVRLIVLGPILFLMMGVSNGFMARFAATPLTSIAIVLGMSALGLLVYAAFVRLIERRPVQELSLPGFGREILVGTLLGATLYTLTVLVLMLAGVYRISGLNPAVTMLPALAMSISAGVFEELIYRGVLFRNLEDLFGSWIALLISSLVFGLGHLMNPEGTLLGALAICLEAGVLLAAAFMVTRRLWICIGLHFAWNFTQSGIFSGVVSGAFDQPGLVQSTLDGSDWLTGGKFGLESSVVAVVICTLAGVLLLVSAIRRNRIIAPVWQRRS